MTGTRLGGTIEIAPVDGSHDQERGRLTATRLLCGLPCHGGDRLTDDTPERPG